jgi:transposase
MTTVIYKIYNIVNSHCYIGSSRQYKRRKTLHISSLRRGKHHSKYLQRAWNKYGESSFIFDIVLDCGQECSKKDKIAYEQFFLDHLLPEYNVSKFADYPDYIPTEESKRKSLEGRRKFHLANPGYRKGKPYNGPRKISEEQKQELLKRLAAGDQPAALAIEYGITTSAMTRYKRMASEKYNVILPYRVLTEQNRKAIGDRNRGKKLSKAQKDAISNGNKGRKHSKESILKRTAACKITKSNKVLPDKILLIRRRLLNGESTVRLAEEFSMPLQTIQYHSRRAREEAGIKEDKRKHNRSLKPKFIKLDPQLLEDLCNQIVAGVPRKILMAKYDVSTSYISNLISRKKLFTQKI